MAPDRFEYCTRDEGFVRPISAILAPRVLLSAIRLFAGRALKSSGGGPHLWVPFLKVPLGKHAPPAGRSNPTSPIWRAWDPPVGRFCAHPPAQKPGLLAPSIRWCSCSSDFSLRSPVLRFELGQLTSTSGALLIAAVVCLCLLLRLCVSWCAAGCTARYTMCRPFHCPVCSRVSNGRSVLQCHGPRPFVALAGRRVGRRSAAAR